MPTLPIVAGYAQAIANASGVASVPLGPQLAGETWLIESITVQCVNSTNATATVYKNAILPANVKASTRQGYNDVDYNANIPLQIGEQIWVVWNNCTPLDICYVTVQGTRNVAGADYAF